jgi:hypothetical protein
MKNNDVNFDENIEEGERISDFKDIYVRYHVDRCTNNKCIIRTRRWFIFKLQRELFFILHSQTN